MNSVQYLIKNRPLSYEAKVAAKALGRPTPDLEIKKSTSGKKRVFNRYFTRENSYDKFSWMCGCEEVSKLFCFVCLLSNDLRPIRQSPWTSTGVDNLQHLMKAATFHERSTSHLDHLIDYSVLDKPDIRKQFDTAYVTSTRAHNEKVKKNRRALRRLITCIRFSGAFELALRGHDEDDRDVFRGLVDFASELDSVLSDHLNDATVFKGTSHTIQDEILDAMFKVCRDEIREQMKKANFIAIEADETADSFNQQQLAVVFRYVFEGEIFERFWGFVRPAGRAAEDVTKAIIKVLEHLDIPADKLIAQSYGGAPLMSGKNGVQAMIRQKYPGAFYVNCYAHNSNLVLEKAASSNKKLKIFFAEIQSFASFFARSPKRNTVLDIIVTAAPTRWDFKTKTINTLYENKEFIGECLEKILDTESNFETIGEVNGLLTILRSADFNYFLEVLNHVIPHVEVLFRQVESREANSSYIQTCLEEFEAQIIEVMDRKIDLLGEEASGDLEVSASKRPRVDYASDTNRAVLEEYFDVLLNQIKDRYDFTGHLSAAALFSPDLIYTYKQRFPEDSFRSTVTTYPVISDQEKLKTELTVIYERDDLRCDGVLPLLTFLNKNDLREGFSETYRLLDILCTTPVTTCESERCFSTLKRIKCFLRNTKTQERLDALAMLSIEKRLVRSINDFDNKVVNVFASSKSRRKDFSYE
jgi:hypothetical protein